MSLVDEVRIVKQRVVDRLAELEPLVREYEQLTLLAGELGVAVSGSRPADAAASGKRPARASGQRSRVRGGRAQAGGKRAKATNSGAPRPARSRTAASPGDGALEPRVLEVVRATPGVSVAQIAELVGVEATALYRPVRELTREGMLVKRARALFPSER